MPFQSLHRSDLFGCKVSLVASPSVCQCALHNRERAIHTILLHIFCIFCMSTKSCSSLFFLFFSMSLSVSKRSSDSTLKSPLEILRQSECHPLLLMIFRRTLVVWMFRPRFPFLLCPCSYFFNPPKHKKISSQSLPSSLLFTFGSLEMYHMKSVILLESSKQPGFHNERVLFIHFLSLDLEAIPQGESLAARLRVQRTRGRRLSSRPASGGILGHLSV